nr:hypothetical protein [uncultured bacterium]
MSTRSPETANISKYSPENLPPATSNQPQTTNRIEFAEKHFRDRHGNPWQLRDYQRPSLNSDAPRKIHCDGRDVGKTTEIEITAAWFLLHCPGQEMLIATQTENHLDPLMHRISRRIDTTPALRSRLVESRRSPSWFFRFDNGAMLWGRIAGPRGINFQGMHVDWQIVDEAQEMTDTAWGELYQALNAGGNRWVYGVPNGLRNTFYRMAQPPSPSSPPSSSVTSVPSVVKSPDLDFEYHHWASTRNPDFTEAKNQELLQLYGGKDSPGYIHRVLGEHGAPAHAVFNLEDYLACVDPTLDFLHLTAQGPHPLKHVPSYSSRSQDDLGNALVPQAELASSSPSSPSSFSSFVPSVSSVVKSGSYFLGCDLGFARDPSEFVIYHSAPPHLINTARIHLANVNYARQGQLIQDLDAAHNFDKIGIDAGNNGRAVAHQLMQLGPEWCDKILAIEFGGTTEIAPLPDGTTPRRRTKEFMTELLVQRMNERTIIFPHLPDRESQYAAHTYEVGAHGQILYQKGNDHLIDADRCALLAHYQHTNEEPPAHHQHNLPPILFTFKFKEPGIWDL